MLAYVAALFLASIGVTTTLQATQPVNTQVGYETNNPGVPSVGTTPLPYDQNYAKLDSTATNLVVYSNAVTSKLNTLPIFRQGVLLSSDIHLPQNFSAQEFAHYVDDKGDKGRYVFVYSAPASSSNGNSNNGNSNNGNSSSNGPVLSIATALAKVTKGDYLAGEMRNGKLYTAGYGTNSVIVVPPQARVPEGSGLYITIVKPAL